MKPTLTYMTCHLGQAKADWEVLCPTNRLATNLHEDITVDEQDRYMHNER